jgi:hypothetical protein
MKKTSTVRENGNMIFKGQELTIGMDLGDHWSCYCVLDEAGKIILEQKVAMTPEAMKQTFSKIPQSLIALETGIVQDYSETREIPVPGVDHWPGLQRRGIFHQVSRPLHFHACAGLVGGNQENYAGRTRHAGLEENLHRGKNRRHQELFRRNGSGEDARQRFLSASTPSLMIRRLPESLCWRWRPLEGGRYTPSNERVLSPDLCVLAIAAHLFLTQSKGDYCHGSSSTYCGTSEWVGLFRTMIAHLNANQQVSMHRPWRIPQAPENSGLGQRTRVSTRSYSSSSFVLR